jgi:hypothetical protein
MNRHNPDSPRPGPRWGWLLAATVAAALTGAFISDAEAQTLDTQLLATGLKQPLFAMAPLNNGRLFVVEKGGAIKTLQGGASSNFFSLGAASGGEMVQVVPEPVSALLLAWHWRAARIAS